MVPSEEPRGHTGGHARCTVVPNLSGLDGLYVTDNLDAMRLLRSLCRNGSAQAVREGAGVGRAEVARAASVSRRTVLRWETGQTVPTGPAAVRYGKLLGHLMRGQP